MKSLILGVIGFGLLFLAFLAEKRCQDREKKLAQIDANINQAQTNLKGAFGGSYRPAESTSPPVSRAPVIILGGLGGIFLLGGLVSLGSRKNN